MLLPRAFVLSDGGTIDVPHILLDDVVPCEMISGAQQPSNWTLREPISYPHAELAEQQFAWQKELKKLGCHAFR